MAPVPEIAGTWSAPFGDLQVADLGATPQHLLVAGHRGTVPTILWRRWRDPGGAFTPLPAVPAPSGWTPGDSEITPILFVDASRDPPQLAVDREEYQGGSWGLVVYPRLGEAVVEQIANPAGDSDIPFGRPTILRGDELFTTDRGGLHQHYRRRGATWHGTRLDTRANESWRMALSDDASLLVLEAAPEFDATRGQYVGEPALELFRRARGAPFVRSQVIPTPAELSGLAFAGDTLVASFSRPTPDGAGLWLLSPPSTVPMTIPVPLEGNGTSVQSLVIAGRHALVAQLSAAWVVDLQARRVTCRLALPDGPQGRVPRPEIIGAGEHAAVLVDNRVGVYDLTLCPRPR